MERAGCRVMTSANGPPASEAVQYRHLLSPEVLNKQTRNSEKLCSIAALTGRGGGCMLRARQGMSNWRYTLTFCA